MNQTQTTGWARPDFVRLRQWFAPTVLVGLAATGLVLIDYRNETGFHVLAALAAVWLATSAASLWAQAADWRPSGGILLQIGAGALVFALVWFDKQTGLFAPAFYPALVFACFAAPLRALRCADSYWAWCEEVLLAAALAGAVASIGFVATTATVWSADRLFGVGAWTREHIAPWSAAIFFAAIGPTAFLAILPRLSPSTAASGIGDFLNRPLAILSSWALTPFVWIYSALLWLYAGKIALARILPDGQIGWMVGAFGITALGTILLIFPQRASGPARVRWLWRLWPFLTVAPLVLLAFALGERLGAYGLTPARYIAVVLTLLCALIAAVALTGRERIVRFAPAAAAGAFLVASFGPWGALGASVRAQAASMRAILAQHGLLRDGALVSDAARVALDGADSRRWNAAVSFLAQQHAFDRVVADADADARFEQKLAALVRADRTPVRRGWYYAAASSWTAPADFAGLRLLGSATFSESGPQKWILGPATLELEPKAFSVRLGDAPPALFDFERIAADFAAGGGKWDGAPVLRPTSGDRRVVLVAENLSMGTSADGAAKASWMRVHLFVAP